MRKCENDEKLCETYHNRISDIVKTKKKNDFGLKTNERTNEGYCAKMIVMKINSETQH